VTAFSSPPCVFYAYTYHSNTLAAHCVGVKSGTVCSSFRTKWSDDVTYPSYSLSLLLLSSLLSPLFSLLSPPSLSLPTMAGPPSTSAASEAQRLLEERPSISFVLRNILSSLLARHSSLHVEISASTQDLMAAFRAISKALNAIDPSHETVTVADGQLSREVLGMAHSAALRTQNKPSQALGQSYFRALLPAVRETMGIPTQGGEKEGEANDEEDDDEVVVAAAVVSVVETTLSDPDSLFWRSDFLHVVKAEGAARGERAARRAAEAQADLSRAVEEVGDM